jgi:hypothetical protein
MNLKQYIKKENYLVFLHKLSLVFIIGNILFLNIVQGVTQETITSYGHVNYLLYFENFDGGGVRWYEDTPETTMSFNTEIYASPERSLKVEVHGVQHDTGIAYTGFDIPPNRYLRWTFNFYMDYSDPWDIYAYEFEINIEEQSKNTGSSCIVAYNPERGSNEGTWTVNYGGSWNDIGEYSIDPFVWHTISVVVDLGNEGKTFILYVDGRKIAELNNITFYPGGVYMDILTLGVMFELWEGNNATIYLDDMYLEIV